MGQGFGQGGLTYTGDVLYQDVPFTEYSYNSQFQYLWLTHDDFANVISNAFYGISTHFFTPYH